MFSSSCCFVTECCQKFELLKISKFFSSGPISTMDVSRSGRIRKKSSKLADFESSDIDLSPPSSTSTKKKPISSHIVMTSSQTVITLILENSSFNCLCEHRSDWLKNDIIQSVVIMFHFINFHCRYF